MKPPSQDYLDNSIQREVKESYLGVRAPMGSREQLLLSAAVPGEASWSRKLRPDWLSASVARQLREKRRSVDEVKYSHLMSGTNLRFAY